jgi:hypothetical protein
LYGHGQTYSLKQGLLAVGQLVQHALGFIRVGFCLPQRSCPQPVLDPIPESFHGFHVCEHIAHRVFGKMQDA